MRKRTGLVVQAALLLLLLLAADVMMARAARADGNSLLLLGGFNLSSPRTALSVGLDKYMDFVGGVGFDLQLKERIYSELDLLYVVRRYSAGHDVPTLTLPLLAKLELPWFFAGVGLYLAVPMGVSSDNGTSTASEWRSLSPPDFGFITQTGLKVKAAQDITAFGEVRISRAINSTYTDPDVFYWTQIDALVGLQIQVGNVRKRR